MNGVCTDVDTPFVNGTFTAPSFWEISNPSSIIADEDSLSLKSCMLNGGCNNRHPRCEGGYTAVTVNYISGDGECHYYGLVFSPSQPSYSFCSSYYPLFFSCSGPSVLSVSYDDKTILVDMTIGYYLQTVVPISIIPDSQEE